MEKRIYRVRFEVGQKARSEWQGERPLGRCSQRSSDILRHGDDKVYMPYQSCLI